MQSSRPYLLRALYDWMLDNDVTPHLMIDETAPCVQVPSGYGHEGMLILSVSPSAVRDLSMTNTDVSFSARFAGKPQQVWLPMAAVKGIFTKETGEGMQFLTEPGGPPADGSEAEEPPEPEPPKRGPGLRVVR